jgi:hypothetical protein
MLVRPPNPLGNSGSWNGAKTERHGGPASYKIINLHIVCRMVVCICTSWRFKLLIGVTKW